jgi:cytidylate kinase
MSHITIAIDGPAGAGKSTISKALAKQLGIIHVDTGAMYRTVALKALRMGADPSNIDEVKPVLSKLDIDIRYIDNEQHVFLDGEDVTTMIRTPEVTKASSDIAVLLPVRERLVDLQRKLAQNMSVVMDGRDIGTNVLPHASYKIFLTASARERAKRRLADLKQQNVDKTLDEVEAEIIARDKVDSSREHAPLKQADDAFFLDTTSLSIEQAVKAALDYIG